MEPTAIRLSKTRMGWRKITTVAGTFSLLAVLSAACDAGPAGANPPPPEAPEGVDSPVHLARVAIQYDGNTGRLTTRILPPASGETRFRASVSADSLLELVSGVCVDCGDKTPPADYLIQWVLRVKSSDYVISNLTVVDDREKSDGDARITESVTGSGYYGSNSTVPINTVVHFTDDGMDKTFTVVFDVNADVYRRTG
jgi:hypothetical protein